MSIGAMSKSTQQNGSSTSPKSREQLLALLETHNIRYVRIQWVDIPNVVRCRVVSVSHFLKLLGQERPGVTTTVAVLGFVGLQLVEGYHGVGENLYVIDLNSLRTCEYAPGHAVVFGFFQHKEPVPRLGGLSYDIPCCPRTNLLRLMNYAEEQLGIKFLVGFETEFILLKSTNPVVAVNDYEWSATAALTAGTVESQVVQEIADAIQKDGIELQMYHAEAAPGQYEIVTGPLSPLEAADALVHTRETIYNIASKHGLKATLAPRLHLDSCGNGAHVHISVQGNQRGTSPSEFLSPLESCFLSGILEHLPALTAFNLPLPASYARMLDGIWSGGTWVCWGVDNREAPVRLTNATSPSSRNFEIKSVDGTSNPYVVLAGILAAGIHGVRDSLELKLKNCNSPTPAAGMTSEEREALGITKRMPLNIEEARQYLRADEIIKDVLGSEAVDLFLQLNELLGKVLDPQDPDMISRLLARV